MPEQTRGWARKKPIIQGLAAGMVFVLAGLLITVPLLGAFGVIWSLVAGLLAAFYTCHLFHAGEVSGRTELQNNGVVKPLLVRSKEIETGPSEGNGDQGM